MPPSPPYPLRGFALCLTLLGLLLLAQSSRGVAPMPPIALHPENPHYFLWRGKPTVLITSGEHYGAVLNLEFDYVRYFEVLQQDGLNLTRTFSGAYREVPGNFNIRDNTLAPRPGRFVAPWARTATPRESDGGGKFDLEKWDDAYFRRLRDLCEQAGRRGIVVELVLFCPFYEEAMWNASPMKATNNVNGVGSVRRNEVYVLKHADLTTVQERLTRKLVTELREFDNVYYEICNEPYAGGVSHDWQKRIAAVITETEAGFPARHLIAQNISNGSAKVEDPNPLVSIFNFHYSNPPDSVGLNYGLNRVTGDDETGFKGTGDAHYRKEGWEFILAGGAVYSNLDYSFTADREDGPAPVTPPTPGGGGPTLRRQLRTLKEFIEGFSFIRMRPDCGVIKGGVPQSARAWALSEPGRQYALYLSGGTRADLSLELPAGRYRVEWLNPRTAGIDKRESIAHGGGPRALASPEYQEDVALRIRREG